jgi:hypothetical protein
MNIAATLGREMDFSMKQFKSAMALPISGVMTNSYHELPNVLQLTQMAGRKTA